MGTRNFARAEAPTVTTFFSNEGLTVGPEVCEDALMAAAAGCAVTFLRTTTALSDEFPHAPSADRAREATHAALDGWKKGLGQAFAEYLEHLSAVSVSVPKFRPNDPEEDRAVASKVADLVSSWVFAVVAAQVGKSLRDVPYPSPVSRQLGVRLVEGFAGWWLAPPERRITWRERLDRWLPCGLFPD